MQVVGVQLSQGLSVTFSQPRRAHSALMQSSWRTSAVSQHQPCECRLCAWHHGGADQGLGKAVPIQCPVTAWLVTSHHGCLSRHAVEEGLGSGGPVSG